MHFLIGYKKQDYLPFIAQVIVFSVAFYLKIKTIASNDLVIIS